VLAASGKVKYILITLHCGCLSDMYLPACSLLDLERYDVPPLQPGERRRLDPADEALLQVRLQNIVLHKRETCAGNPMHGR
jgi:hypothetical protein